MLFSDGWVDAHAHLDFFGSDKHIKEVVFRAAEQGVNGIITAADCPSSSKLAVGIAEKFEYVYAAVGVHPHEVSLLTTETEKELYKLADHEKVVAIGEIGLDYYRDAHPHSEQQRAFACQLEIAKELNLPAIIHNREASPHVLSILKKINFPSDKTVLHCFCSEEDIADEVVERGYYVSLSGIATFNNVNDSMLNVIKKLPENRIMLETDSPFLSPHPFRGETNEPSFLPLIGSRIAEIRGVDVKHFCNATRENTNRFFFGESNQ